MEAGRKTTLTYVVLTVLVVVAGALYFAYQQRGEEGERLAAALVAASGERDSLKSERNALRGERDVLGSKAQAERERASALEAEVAALQRKYAELAAEKDRLSQGLTETQRKAAAAAAARAELSRELQAKEQTLEQAKARSAELNKAYESLLKDKSQLAASDAAHRAELERTRKSFEEVQSLIARLTGARGIYTVQDTDSLSKIAAFFYHDGLRWPDIFRANAHLIDHPDLIYPEQVLIVPH
jgi:nucleoid-associated protein YgaU